jgi:hypothetical protein
VLFIPPAAPTPNAVRAKEKEAVKRRAREHKLEKARSAPAYHCETLKETIKTLKYASKKLIGFLFNIIPDCISDCVSDYLSDTGDY